MEDQEGTTVPTIPEDISELLERRATFRGWLTKLDGQAGDVRRTVYERVREDYLGRLSGVEDELQGHREGLEASLGERRARMQELEQERDERAAQREEVELRHRVGEYSDEEWESRRAEHQGTLEELEGRLAEEGAAVDRLQEVLGELDAPASASPSGEEGGRTGEEGPETPAGGETPEVAAVVAERESAYEAEPDEEVETAAAAGADGTEQPEDAALTARSSWLSGSLPEPALGGRSGSEPEEPGQAREGEGDFEDELDFLESLSLEDSDSLDTLSLVLDDEEDEEGGEERNGGDGAA